MKWDVDKALAALESRHSTAGTEVTRVLMAVDQVPPAIKITEEERTRGTVLLWCLSLGLMQRPKVAFHGRTIRQACLLARKTVRRMGQDWLDQMGLERPRKKPKPQPRRKRKKG